MKMRRNFVYIVLALLSLLTACSDNENVLDTQIGQAKIPMRFSLGDLVDMNTRGTGEELGYTTFEPGQSVGVFVMYERDLDSLREGSDYHNISYYYDNVECRIDESGNLHPKSIEEMFYPMGLDSKIAVFAYAPYDSTMTRKRLLNSQDTIFVSSNQSIIRETQNNDLILATPLQGNPLLRPAIDGTSGSFPTASIKLNFRHQRSRVVLNVTLDGGSEFMDGKDFLLIDTMYVYAENVPMCAPSGCKLDDTMNNFAPADILQNDTMLMACFTDIDLLNTQKKTFTSIGIVLPSNTPVELSFRIEFVTAQKRSKVRRKAVVPVMFERGASLNFKTTISESMTEEDDESTDYDEVPVVPDTPGIPA